MLRTTWAPRWCSRASATSGTNRPGAPDSMTRASGEHRIERLPDIIADLSPRERATVESIFDIRRDVVSMTVPAPMVPSVERQFGDLAAVSDQIIVAVTNRYTLEGTSFNNLRALRPMTRSPSSEIEQSETGRFDPFADPLTQTPDNAIGRVRGRRCVTAANLAASDAWHGVIIFDEPDPFVFDSEDVADYLSTGLEWARKAHSYDVGVVHPFLFWNANARAGASLPHGHAQVVVRRDAPFSRIEVQRSASTRYREINGGANYFDNLMRSHASLGLASRVGESSVVTHLTPIKEREMLVIGTGLNDEFFRSIGQVLVAFRDSLGVESFNLGVFGQPLGSDESTGWEGFPAVARIVDRGRTDVRSSDFAGMELYGQSVVSADPFEAARMIAKAI